MMTSRRHLAALLILLLAAAILLPASLLAATPSTSSAIDLAAPSLSERALSLDDGARLAVAAVPLGDVLATLELERFEAWTGDAEVVIHRADGSVDRVAPPIRAYLRGTVAGTPSSRAVLSVGADGSVRGLVADRGGWWIVGDSTRAGRLEAPTARALDAATLDAGRREFTCGADALRESPEGVALQAAVDLEEELLRPVVETLGGGEFTARVALETDTAYLDRFGGSTVAATAYAGDLIAYISTLYDTEVSTDLQISSLSLWQGSDPWNQTSANCGLFEFGGYWNQNNSAVDRTIAHFLSGRSSLSGIAWVGVLCNGGFTTTVNGCPGLTPTGQYGGDYGYTSGISGSFDIDNPSTVWDMVAVAHEIGHNFNSPHTHCYQNLGGSGSPVDQCFSGQCGQSGCWCGGQSLPCPGGQSGCGTLMSYCHLLSGGLGNMSPTFGQGHPWGVEPERVPERMSAHVMTRATSNPGCLDRQAGPDLVFADDFESGNTSNW